LGQFTRAQQVLPQDKIRALKQEVQWISELLG